MQSNELLTPSDTSDQYPMCNMMALPNPVIAKHKPATNITDDSSNTCTGVVIFTSDKN